jgi:metal-responsive CopG/Arc/MetJ family transcriptional regulator
MKTAISIPDDVFQSAEELAERTGKSRSELYTQAVRKYVARHQTSGVTKKLNEVYGGEDSRLDEGFKRLRNRGLAKEQW